MRIEQATQHIARARRQFERVAIASWDPPDAEAAVTWAFYAYENCVAALGELYDRTWKLSHWDKARLARDIYAEGLISRDVGDDLEALNALRKDVAYGEPGEDLQSCDLEDLCAELELFVEEVASRIEEVRSEDDGC